MTRQDAQDFLKLAAEIQITPQVTTFALPEINRALTAVLADTIDGAAVVVLGA